MKLSEALAKFSSKDMTFDELKAFVSNYKDWAPPRKNQASGDPAGVYPQPDTWEEINSARVRRVLTLAQAVELLPESARNSTSSAANGSL